jgi:hypothetical protein
MLEKKEPPMRRIAVIIISLAIFSSTKIFAQPTTAPTTQAQADPTTPKGTLTLLNRATAVGDTASVRKLMHVATTQESRVADALVNRTAAFAKFRDAAVKSFGADAASKLTGDQAETDAAEQAIQHADVTIDKDKATVQMDGQPVNLVKVDGNWQLSLAGLTAGLSPADVDKMLDQMSLFVSIMSQTTDELAKGKYKSPDEVNDAMRARLATAMMQAQPTTQPTSAPAGS